MRWLGLVFGLWAATPALAAEGFEFAAGDWVLVCSNSGQCSAVGYHAGEASSPSGDLPVSVRIQRDAAIDSDAEARLMLEAPQPDALRLNGRLLAPGLLVSLLQANPAQDLVVSDGTRRWVISSRGAAAVLAKMDDFQRRSGTPSALMRRGTQTHPGALADERPTILAAAVPADEAVGTGDSEALRRLLQAPLGNTELAPYGCQRLDVGNHPNQPQSLFMLYPLSADRVLAEVYCTYGNGSRLYAVLNRNFDQVIDVLPVANTAMTRYANGVLTAQTARGTFAECYRDDQYVWDGRRFVLSRRGSSGLCGKGRMSHVWDSLPLFETKVLRAAP